MVGEQWRPVLGFEKFYEVSDYGRVQSFDRMVKRVVRDVASSYFRRGTVLSPSRSPSGYIHVNLSLLGKKTSVDIHVLVWKAFNGLVPAGFEVNHKDGIKTNCRLSNLELRTPKGNMKHAVEMGLMSQNGELNASAKLRMDEVLCIRDLYETGVFTQSELASDFNVSGSHISLIVNRKLWNHL